RGGHNVVEPARYSKPIVTGPYTQNFRDMIGLFIRDEAIIQLKESDPAEPAGALARELIRLLENPAEASAMGRPAHALAAGNQGATDRVIQAIRSIVSTGPAI